MKKNNQPLDSAGRDESGCLYGIARRNCRQCRFTKYGD